MVGQRPIDERDSIFKGAELRHHNYQWTLVPKADGEAKIIADICQAFQTLAYPSSTNAQVYSRVTHPPIWWINAMDLHPDSTSSRAFRWDMGPLPSCLKNVSVETASDGVFTHKETDGQGYPAATRLKLGFVELEPAVNAGKHIQSRSMVRGRLPDGNQGE